ncbi:hypothetical protein I547_4900 [Mycobacterium kansasii 824]|nr:hypothetical protein I547_4900 [Mycobacterium kansasii 824]
MLTDADGVAAMGAHAASVPVLVHPAPRSVLGGWPPPCTAARPSG